MPRFLARRVALSLLALGSAAILVQSTSMESTSAAWVDSEVAKATITANWFTKGFARISQNGWKLEYTGRSGTDYPYTPQSRNFTYQISTETGSDVATLPTSTYAQGTTKRASVDFGDASYTVDTSIVGPRATSEDVWEGTNIDNGITQSHFCLAMNLTLTTPSCTSTTPPPRAESTEYLTNVSYSIESSYSKAARINVEGGYSTTAQCFEDGRPPFASITDNGASSSIKAAYESTYSGTGYGGALAISGPGTDSSSSLSDGWGQWYRYNVQGGTDSSYVLLIAQRRNTFVQTSPPYALAELGLNVQVYSSGGVSSSSGYYVDSLNLVLSRSECGLATSNQTAPARRGTFLGDANQSAWPAPVYSTVPYGPSSGPLGFGPAAQPVAPLMAHAAPVTVTATSTIPSGVSTTSPLETATAQTTTTSAPPTPSTTPTQTATSSLVPTTFSPSAATSASAIPLAPAPLRPGEPTTRCGSVQVNGALVDAVALGSQRPPDCGDGIRVLNLWIAQQTQVDFGWIVYASRNPGSDGWRWATISQTTGTTMYVR